MEAAGAVFLPAAGNRNRITVSNSGTEGYYWSSTYSDGRYALGLRFTATTFSRGIQANRYNGLSVRLVCPAE